MHRYRFTFLVYTAINGSNEWQLSSSATSSSYGDTVPDTLNLQITSRALDIGLTGLACLHFWKNQLLTFFVWKELHPVLNQAEILQTSSHR